MKKLITILLAAMLVASCSQKPKYERAMSKATADNYELMQVAYESTADVDRQFIPSRSRTEVVEVVYEEYVEVPPVAGPNQEQLLVKTANVSVKVDNLDNAGAAVTNLMKKYEAYASSTNIYENSHNYTIRVPKDRYNDFLIETGRLGKIVYSFENIEDVSVQYYDLEGRLETQKELLVTFRSYLGKAKNIDEILSVEARIAQLQAEIDGTGKQFRGLADRINYATIALSLEGPTAIDSYRGPGLGEKTRELFGNFGGFLSTLATILMGIVIYGIPILALVALLFWLLLGRVGLLKKLWRVVAKK